MTDSALTGECVGTTQPVERNVEPISRTVLTGPNITMDQLHKMATHELGVLEALNNEGRQIIKTRLMVIWEEMSVRFERGESIVGISGTGGKGMGTYLRSIGIDPAKRRYWKYEIHQREALRLAQENPPTKVERTVLAGSSSPPGKVGLDELSEAVRQKVLKRIEDEAVAAAAAAQATGTPNPEPPVTGTGAVASESEAVRSRPGQEVADYNAAINAGRDTHTEQQAAAPSPTAAAQATETQSPDKFHPEESAKWPTPPTETLVPETVTFADWQKRQLPTPEYKLKYFAEASDIFSRTYMYSFQKSGFKKIIEVLRDKPDRVRSNAQDFTQLAAMLRAVAANANLLAAAIDTALTPSPVETSLPQEQVSQERVDQSDSDLTVLADEETEPQKSEMEPPTPAAERDTEVVSTTKVGDKTGTYCARFLLRVR